MSKDSVELLNAVTKTEIMVNEEDGEINMCKAIEDMKKEAEAMGINKARTENAINLYKNGVSLELISKSLNMDTNELKNILIQNNVKLRVV